MRRSSRTVLDILFYQLTSWLAPILVFTSEEVWLERFRLSATSIHLQDIPEVPKNWDKPAIAKKWDEIRRVRRVVTGAIEVQRQNKVIGSSLEASPTVIINNKDLFKIVSSIDFAEVCITSSISIKFGELNDEMFRLPEVDSVGVIFGLASGMKCKRCWKYTDKSDCRKEPKDCCQRCSETLLKQAK